MYFLCWLVGLVGVRIQDSVLATLWLAGCLCAQGATGSARAELRFTHRVWGSGVGDWQWTGVNKIVNLWLTCFRFLRKVDGFGSNSMVKSMGVMRLVERLKHG